MNTKPSRKFKFNRGFANILSIFVILAMAFPATGSASAQEPVPHFYASTAHNSIWGADFVPGAQLTFSIYDAAGGDLLWSGEKAADGSGQAWLGGEDHPVDLVPGYQIVISMEGTPVKDLILEEITVDLFDVDQGLLQGMAPAGRTVWVGVDFDNTHLGMEVTADPETGVWIADFDTPVPSNYTWAGAQLFDSDGDATEANPPRPTITISTSNNYLRADQFIPGALLTFTVYATPNPGESPLWSDSRTTDGNGFAIIWPWEQPLDLVIGNYVIVTDGINEKQLMLEAVTLAVFDPDADFLGGTAPTAPEGRFVWVWAGNGSNGCGMGVTADPVNGAWTADFTTQPCDITAEMEGAAHIYDEDGDVTVFHQGPPPPPPSPWFIAFPENDAVEGWEWPDRATVTLTINNAPGLSWSGTAAVTTWGDPRTYVRIEFGNEYNLQVGDVVTLTDEFGTSTTHTVQNLSVTEVNGEADTVSGTANPGAVVQVWPHGYDQDFFIEDIAEDGTWFADFGALGFHTIEETGGRSQIVIDGNATAVDWSVPPPPPNPFIAVSLTDHWISLSYFSPDTPVTISIYKSKDHSKPVVELNRSTDESGNLFIPSWAYNWDLEPGNLVTATDGVITKELLLEYLTLDVFDPGNDLVSGSAMAGREVGVGVGNADGEQWLNVFADEVNGVWTADFTAVEFDITADMWAGGHVNDEDGDVTAAHNTGAPEPQFVVFPEWEWFDGNHWPDGASVKITVQGKSECKVTKESWGGFFNGSFGEGCDVAIGDLVKFTDGKTTRTHVVRNLAITAVDPGENTITGTADTGTNVYVWPHDSWFEPLQAVADDSGLWQVDLDDAGYDLQEGASGRSEIRDETGNATAVDWYVPNPFFQVQLETNHVDGWEWTPNSQVTISIDGVEVATVPTDEWGTFRSHFGELAPFVSGMDFVITDGVSTKTLTTAYLEITNVNPDADTVSGNANAGQTFNVWVHGPENAPTVQVTADVMGQWIADFSGQWNIVPGSDGAAQIDDEDRDGTWVPWRVPNPRFTIFPLWQWYDGLDWPNGATVTITVAGKPACNVTKTSSNYFFNGGFSQACYVEAGDTITFADGTTSRTHVVRNLAVTNIDLNKDTIRGTADAGTIVYVWPHDGWFEPLQAIANNSGAWQVDLGDMGYDIVEGASGRAEIRDDTGNATAVDWNLNARIVVQITDDWFRAEGFAPNTSLKFQIYDALGGNLLLKSKTAETDSSGTVTHWVGDQVDLGPSNFVVVSDGKTTKDIVLEALTFDLFDTSLGVLQGTAPEPFGRTVSVGIGCWQRDDLTADTTADESGAWIVDFQIPVPNDFGCVFAWIYETDGDVSEARPEQIIWWSE